MCCCISNTQFTQYSFAFSHLKKSGKYVENSRLNDKSKQFNPLRIQRVPPAGHLVVTG